MVELEVVSGAKPKVEASSGDGTALLSAALTAREIWT
jgi:hypothetical protein